MALVERDGKVYARKLWIFLGAKEWGRVTVHGCEDADLPYPVRYHDEGFPARGIDPREFAAWARN
jgi:hypothetical protein